jgi:pimeloyl-ACP methyl ester carboxylesterase
VAASPDDDRRRAPGPLLLLLETRAPLEFAASVAAAPWLRRLPRGDARPVIVYPGLGASDISTAPLRRLLQDRGYTPHGWHQGRNLGPRGDTVEACLSQLEELARLHGAPVSLVGWSLGGLYAREVAKARPDLARCVITLGSPFSGHPNATNAWRLYRAFNGHAPHEDERYQQLRVPPPVPTTSIFSRSDGIVAWHCSLNEPGPLAENIEVPASHIGLGVNPLALYAILDRLAQDPADWHPFDLRGVRRWFFRIEAPNP